MFKKLLMAGLLMLSSATTMAGDFAPFGVKIGSKTTLVPATKQVTNEYISVIPPRPVPKFFDDYHVRFNATKQVEHVSATGDLTNSQYKCSDVARILRDTFVKNYPNATSGNQYGAFYSFEVKDGKDFYAAYITCKGSNIEFVMYNPFLETDPVNDPDLKGLDLKL